MSLSEDEWLRRTTSKNVNIQENRFKVTNGWYLTPNRLVKMFPNMREECWRCGGSQADFFHVWWMCDNKLKNGVNLKLREIVVNSTFHYVQE